MNNLATASLSDATLIIRSAGERTVELCKKLILDQGVPEAQVFVVQEVPFSAAMRKSFEIGINEGRKWTFCVDADVLLRPGSIAHMIGEAEKQPENVCEIQGLVMDKFFGGPRPAGNHLYRTSLLPEVIKRIPEEGVNIRPEHHTLLSMANDGFPWVQIPYIVGTHDDEQYNFDIYRKCFVQATKHLYLADLFIPLWKRNIENDHDFEVALKGFSDGIRFIGEAFINSQQRIYLEGFKNSGFSEKEPLNIGDLSLHQIDQAISNWKEPQEYARRYPDRFGLNANQSHIKGRGRIKRWNSIIFDQGILKGSIELIGRALVSFGKDMIKAVSKS